MKQLLLGCKRSNIAVTPDNWNTKAASLTRPWRITYRFYDPQFRSDPKKWGKQISILGMNEYKTLEERQAATRALLENEQHLLDTCHYNPVTDKYMVTETSLNLHEITPDSNFILAMEWAKNNCQAIHDTKIDMKSVLKYVEIAAKALFDTKMNCYYCYLPISAITRRHIVYLLKYCEENNKRWSNLRFNKYKAYLSMMFRELIAIEAIESNPTNDIEQRQVMIKQPQILTTEERAKINTLREGHYNFWRFIQVFFHSGSRATELLSIKPENVNLEQQEFRLIVKKGKKIREDIRPISDAALDLWKEVMKEAKPGQFLFARLLQPGDKKIGKSQPGRYWNRYVRPAQKDGGLGINKRWYELKHTHTDAIAEAIDIRHAASANGHTTPVITMKHYAVNEKKRMRDRLKTAEVAL